jgi:peptidoglycan/xylan/chitin deacetylase (PgdA/CDA1 family)
MPGMRPVIRRALRRVPVGMWQRISPKPTFGVCYHVVSDRKLQHLKHYPPLASAEFEKDVRYLKQTFRVVEYDEAVRRRSVEHVVHDNTVMLTFDDGFAQCATVIRPILRSLDASATFFLVTDLIDNHVIFRESQASLCIDAVLRHPVEGVLEAVREVGKDVELPWLSIDQPSPPKGFGLDVADLGGQTDLRLQSLFRWLLAVGPEDRRLVDRLCEQLEVDVDGYLKNVRPYLSLEQIHQLQSDGFTLGAHSRSHQRLQDLSRAEATEEIVESCRIIRDLTGQKSVPFAFPYSGWGLDRDWLARLRHDHDFIGLYFDTGGLRDDAPFVVQRVFGERVTRDRSMDSILRSAWAQAL